ncbi:unnamed protein product, partial [Prorocentrum cordatum]
GLRSGRALARRPLQRPAARPRCGRPPPRGGLGAGPRGSAQAVVAGRGGLVGAAVAARRAGAARAVRGEGANPRRQRGGPEGQARHVPGVREAAEAAGGRRPGLGPGCAPVTPAAARGPPGHTTDTQNDDDNDGDDAGLDHGVRDDRPEADWSGGGGGAGGDHDHGTSTRPRSHDSPGGPTGDRRVRLVFVRGSSTPTNCRSRTPSWSTLTARFPCLLACGRGPDLCRHLLGAPTPELFTLALNVMKIFGLSTTTCFSRQCRPSLLSA